MDDGLVRNGSRSILFIGRFVVLTIRMNGPENLTARDSFDDHLFAYRVDPSVFPSLPLPSGQESGELGGDSADDDSDEEWSLCNKVCTYTVTQKDFMDQHW